MDHLDHEPLEWGLIPTGQVNTGVVSVSHPQKHHPG